MSDWYTYVLHCADGSLYTGITVDLQRRLHEHNHDDRLAAKYTRTRRPLSLVYSECVPTRSAACQREVAIKKMTRWQKQQLVDATICDEMVCRDEYTSRKKPPRTGVETHITRG